MAKRQISVSVPIQVEVEELDKKADPTGKKFRERAFAAAKASLQPGVVSFEPRLSFFDSGASADFGKRVAILDFPELAYDVSSKESEGNFCLVLLKQWLKKRLSFTVLNNPPAKLSAKRTKELREELGDVVVDAMEVALEDETDAFKARQEEAKRLETVKKAIADEDGAAAKKLVQQISSITKPRILTVLDA